MLTSSYLNLSINQANTTVLMASLLCSCMIISTLNPKLEPERTHRVQTHAVLLLTLTLTLTFDLSTQNHAACKTSEGHSLYQVITLWDHLFLCYAADKPTNRRTQKSHARRQT